MGVGRSFAPIPFWVHLITQLGGLNSASPGAIAFTGATQPQGQVIQSGGGPFQPIFPPMDRITCSELQVQAFGFADGGAADSVVGLEIGCQVAPIAQIRPEWFEDPAFFPGEENTGS